MPNRGYRLSCCGLDLHKSLQILQQCPVCGRQGQRWLTLSEHRFAFYKWKLYRVGL